MHSREAITDESGSYELTDVPPVVFLLLAERRGYIVECRDNSVANGGTDAEIDFTAIPAGEVTLAVRLPNGEMPLDAEIRCGGEGSHSYQRWTKRLPTIKLPLGTHQISAIDGNQSEYSSKWESVTLAERGQAVTAELRLFGRPGIKGRVRFPQDENYSRCYVSCQRTSAGRVETSADSVGAEKTRHLQPYQRSFLYRDLYPGAYCVTLYRSLHGPPVASQIVEVSDGLEELEMDLPLLINSESSVLWAFDPDGNPVRNLQSARYEVRWNDETRRGVVALAQKKDGSYWWPARFLPKEEWDEATDEESQVVVSMEVEPRGLGKKRFSAVYGREQEFTVRFSLPASVHVTVTGFDQSPEAPAMSVKLEAIASVEGIESHAAGAIAGAAASFKPVGADGTTTLGPVQPGKYEVVLAMKAHGDEEECARMAITLAPGANAVKIALPAFHSLTVLCAGAEPGSNFHIWRSVLDARPITAEIDDQGRASVEHLTPGEYAISLPNENGVGVMTVQVPGPAQVVFAPQAVDALRVAVTSEDGRLARAGFRDGDLIIGVDGAEFENAQQMMFLLMSHSAAARVQLNILRGGVRLEIAASLSEWTREQTLGGTLLPAAR